MTDAPQALRLADRGNTDAKLFVTYEAEDNKELRDEAPEGAEAPGEGGPESREAA